MNITWDAKGYQRNFQFVPQYGEDVLNLLELVPGASVLDLGCGNGALTRKLADRGYRVLGLDESREMLQIAAKAYPDLSFMRADATSFVVPEPVDAVFFNAVFHWIEDQDALLAHVASALRPGGQLVCEFGGRGCVESAHASLEQSFALRGLAYPRTFYFPTIGEYAPRLEAHGLRVVWAALFDRPTELKGERGMEDWMRMFVVRAFEGMSEELKEEIIHEAAERIRAQ